MENLLSLSIRIRVL